MNIYIIHDADLDGATAAAVLKDFYQNQEDREFKLEFFPRYNNRDSVPEEILDLEDTENSICYVLDLSLPSACFKVLSDKFERLIIIDHHATTPDRVGDIKVTDLFFSTRFSTAMLTWLYTNSDADPDDEEITDEEFDNMVPRFVKLVNDADLFNFKYEDTKPLTSYAYAITRFVGVDTAYHILKDEALLDDYIKRGKEIMEENEMFMDAYVDDETNFLYMALRVDGYVYDVAVFNKNEVNGLYSQVSAKVLEKYEHIDFVISKESLSSDMVGLSFRSRKDSDNLSMTEIASSLCLYGSGGHKSAAGGKISKAAWIRLPYYTLKIGLNWLD